MEKLLRKLRAFMRPIVVPLGPKEVSVFKVDSNSEYLALITVRMTPHDQERIRKQAREELPNHKIHFIFVY